MINYYEQLSELKFAEERLETLIEKKEMLRSRIMKVTSQPKDIVVTGGGNSDKMATYMIQVEKIDSQIEEVVEEIRVLKKGLETMEELFNEYNDYSIEKQVFNYLFIKNKNVTYTAKRIPCDRSTVYKYKKIIENKFNDKKNQSPTKSNT